jgi:hypothetical protein
VPFSFETFRFDASGEAIVIGPRSSFGRLEQHSVEYADRARIWLARLHAHPDAVARLRASSGTWWHGDTHNLLSDAEIVERVLADLARGRLAAFLIPQADALYMSTPDPSRVESALATSPVLRDGDGKGPGQPAASSSARPKIGAPEPVRGPQMVRPQAPAGPVRAKNVRAMSLEERLYVVLKAAADSTRLSDEGRRHLAQLSSSAELHASIGALATWAAALQLGTAYLMEGALPWQALLGPLEESAEALSRLRDMLERVGTAKSDLDLDAASDLFAAALMLLDGARLRQALAAARRRPLPVEKERERPQSRGSAPPPEQAPRYRPVPAASTPTPAPAPNSPEQDNFPSPAQQADTQTRAAKDGTPFCELCKSAA